MNQSVFYTVGIIFVEINDLSIPVSLTGITVVSTTLNFELITPTSPQDVSVIYAHPRGRSRLAIL
jgi:hypothetical protein